MFIAELTEDEKKVIKRVAKIQIECLNNLIQENAEIDVTMFAIENEVDKAELISDLEVERKKYEIIHDYPETFLNNEDDVISIFKHILVNFVNKRKRAKSKIWRKLNLRDNFLFNPN